LNPLDEPSSAEDELRLAFGKAIGFTAAALILLLGGGILVIVLAAAFFGFLFGS
jgi:hypothetical protein